MRGKKDKKVSKFKTTMEDFSVKRERNARKARNIREMKSTEQIRVSYVKKPLARRSLMSIGLAFVGMLLFLVGILMAIRARGQAELYVAAIGFCSMLLSAVAVFYGVISYMEKEKNYILAKIGIGAGGTVVLVWFIMIIAGMRG